MAEATEELSRPKINELDKYTMFANIGTTGGKASRLAWSIRAASPRITVYTNNSTDTINYGIISAPMNPETFLIFLDLLEQTALGANGDKHKIECYTSTRGTDGSYGERTVLSEVVFGKDEAGIVWVSVIAEGRPKIKFEFKVYDYHKIYKADGSQMSESETSSLQALAVIKALRSIYHDLTKEFRQNKGTNGQTPGKAVTPPPVAFDMDDIGF